MGEKKVIVMWKDERGLYSQEAPGRKIASNISKAALRNLGRDHNVFVLELSEDRESIEVTRL